MDGPVHRTFESCLFRWGLAGCISIRRRPLFASCIWHRGRVVQASDRNSDHGSSNLPDVFGSSGDYGAMVSTRDCGPRNGFESGGSPCGGVAQLDRASGRDPEGWQFKSARRLWWKSHFCQYRSTAERKREDLETMVRLHLLASSAFLVEKNGSVAQ